MPESHYEDYYLFLEERSLKWYEYLFKSLYYFRTGYGLYLGFALGLLTFSTTMYYLAIERVPLLKQLFPGFLEFTATLFVLVYTIGHTLGYIHYKKLPVYRMEQEVNVESNPYANWKVTPNAIPQLKLFARQARMLGMNEEADVMESIIRRSEGA